MRIWGSHLPQSTWYKAHVLARSLSLFFVSHNPGVRLEVGTTALNNYPILVLVCLLSLQWFPCVPLLQTPGIQNPKKDLPPGLAHQ